MWSISTRMARWLKIGEKICVEILEEWGEQGFYWRLLTILGGDGRKVRGLSSHPQGSKGVGWSLRGDLEFSRKAPR